MKPILIEETLETYQGAMPIPVELFAEGNPTAEVWANAAFASVLNLKAGIWIGQSGKINVPAYPTDEIFTVLSGEIRLHELDGSSLSIGPGQACLIRKGWVGVWENAETTRKTYLTFEV